MKPDKLALVEGEHRMTHGELRDAATRLTHAYLRLGVRADARLR